MLRFSGKRISEQFLTNRGIKKCIVFLSDNRIYMRGNMININSNKFERFNMHQTIDLEDITRIGFIYAGPQLWKLIIALLTIPLIIPAILLIVSYTKSRDTLLCVLLRNALCL